MIVERDVKAALADKLDELINPLSASAGKVGLVVPCEPRRTRSASPTNTGSLRAQSKAIGYCLTRESDEASVRL